MAAAIAALALFAAGCATPKETARAPSPAELDRMLQRSDPTRAAPRPDILPGWHQDAHGDALPALLQSCRALTVQQMAAIGGVEATPDDWVEPCLHAATVDPADHLAARLFFEQWFVPVKVESESGGNGRFTGYYEAQLHGSWTRSKRYHVPLYRYPGREANRRLPSRAEIARGALKPRKLELLWVDSAFDALVLEIQGSGRVHMDDGSLIGIGYAGQNGHAFVDPTAPLHRRRLIPERTFAALKAYLDRAPPARRQAALNLNPSVVFFKLREGEAPIGAQGVPLTPGRSLAVDPRHVPLGALLWLHIPQGPGGAELRRVVVAQDTGGAITGPVRGDVYWGNGQQAKERALATNAQGQYYMLVPRSAQVLTQLAR